MAKLGDEKRYLDKLAEIMSQLLIPKVEKETENGQSKGEARGKETYGTYTSQHKK